MSYVACPNEIWIYLFEEITILEIETRRKIEVKTLKVSKEYFTGNLNFYYYTKYILTSLF